MIAYLFVFTLGALFGTIAAAFMIACADSYRARRASRIDWQGPVKWER